DELGAPARVGAEVARERGGERRAGLAGLAQAIEEELVQDHGIGGDQLLTLEAVDEKAGRGRRIEPGELLLDQVEALHGAAIVVLVVADDQALRHAAHAGRIAGQRLGLKAHGMLRGCLVRSSLTREWRAAAWKFGSRAPVAQVD